MLSGVIVFYQTPRVMKWNVCLHLYFPAENSTIFLLYFELLIVSVISCYIMLSSVAFITLKGIKDT